MAKTLEEYIMANVIETMWAQFFFPDKKLRFHSHTRDLQYLILLFHKEV